MARQARNTELIYGGYTEKKKIGNNPGRRGGWRREIRERGRRVRGRMRG